MADIVCDVPAGMREKDLKPFPGSYDATLLHGCRCPEQRGWPQRLRLAEDCPLLATHKQQLSR